MHLVLKFYQTLFIWAKIIILKEQIKKIILMKNLKKLAKNAMIPKENDQIKGGGGKDKIKDPKNPPNPCFDPLDKRAWYCPTCSRG